MKKTITIAVAMAALAGCAAHAQATPSTPCQVIRNLGTTPNAATLKANQAQLRRIEPHARVQLRTDIEFAITDLDLAQYVATTTAYRSGISGLHIIRADCAGS